MAVEQITSVNGETEYVDTTESEYEQPQPSDVNEPLCIGIDAEEVSYTHTMYDMWEEVITCEIASFFDTSTVNVKEIELETNSERERVVGSFFAGEVWIDGVPLEFTAGYFSGRTGVLPEESGLDDDNGLPESPSWKEVGEWWNDDWGTWGLGEYATLVISDDGMPDSKKRELQEKHRSRVRVSYDSSDTSCTNGGAIDDQTDMESKSFSERMNSLADDLDAQAREQQEQDVIQYLRDNRDTFKAEITDVRARTEGVVIELDVPTHGEWSYTTKLPDGDGRGGRLYEILSYLNADLRHMDMIEGMYLPMAYVDGDWVLQLPSDAPPFTESFWLKPRSFSLPSIPRPPVMGMLCVVGVLMGVIGMAVTPNANFLTDFMFFIVFMLSIIGCIQKWW